MRGGGGGGSGGGWDVRNTPTYMYATETGISVNLMGHWAHMQTLLPLRSCFLLKLKAEMVYKSLNGLTPNYLSSKFIQRSDVITSYNLRDSENKLAIPLPRTNYYKNSFGYSGAVLWNSLPSAARQATPLNNFRRLLINSDTAFM